MAVGIAGFGGFVLMQSGIHSPDSAKLTSYASKGSRENLIDPATTEAPLVLTSFQTLEPITETEVRTETLQRGDTLTDLMDRLGVDRAEANAALYSLYNKELIDARKVRPGLEVSAHVEASATEENPDAIRLVGLTLKHAKEASLIVTRDIDGAYSALELHTKLLPKTRRINGTVQSTIYEAALEAGADWPCRVRAALAAQERLAPGCQEAPTCAGRAPGSQRRARQGDFSGPWYEEHGADLDPRACKLLVGV